MCAYLFRDSAGVLTQEAGDVLERNRGIKAVLDVEAILSGKMFMVTWNEFTHEETPSAVYRSRDIIRYVQQ